MARKADRQRGEIRIGGPAIPVDQWDEFWRTGQAPQDGAQEGFASAGQLDDELILLPGVSVNGAPPLMQLGAAVVKIGRVACHCRAIVADLYMLERTAQDSAVVYYLTVQTLSDRHVRPVAMRTTNRLLLGPGGLSPADLTTDCQAHGAQLIVSRQLLKFARECESCWRAGRTKLSTFTLPRVS